MSHTPVEQRWRVLVTPRWLSWHAFAVLAFAGMWWLGDWQFRRAMAGNSLSWAYTFEWPIFALFGAVFWVKTVRDELHPKEPAPAEQVSLPPSARNRSLAAAGDLIVAYEADEGINGVARAMLDSGDEDDPAADSELAEYNAYLARLNKEVKRHGKWHGLR